MPSVKTNGISIAYDFYGPDEGPVVMLIMGLGMPSTAWPPGLIEHLTGSGFRVLTFDNRDIGRSQVLDSLKTPGLFMQGVRHALRLPVRAPYALEDMAADAGHLLSSLGISRAHVVGISMGGMIGQILAINESAKVSSLTSIMSTTGSRQLPGPTAEIRRMILKGPKGPTQEARIAHYRELWPMISSPAYPQPDEYLDEFLERIFDRGLPPNGIRRQILAIMAASDRIPALKKLRTPTLVIHGDADPLVPVECGYDTAETIRDAEMVVIEGMGHNLPDQLLARLADLIAGHAKVSDSEALAAS